MHIQSVSLSGKSIVAIILIVLGVIVAWLVAICIAILASAILVDTLWHLGRWLLGW
jgi:hypothetical protein